MARIVLGSYMVRYPLGGMMSWVLQYLVGFKRLGHEIYLVEKSGYPNACFDPVKNVMTDDCSYGAAVVDELLSRFGLDGCWCYCDQAGEYFGMTRKRVEEVFASADLFIDMGTHGGWLDEAATSGLRVLIDGEPGFTQMKMENRLATGETLPDYDYYYTTGQSVGTPGSSAPDAGKSWRTIFHPVCVELFEPNPVAGGGCYTTVMNWQSYQPVPFRGDLFGHKDVEFEKFVDLPQRTAVCLEQAVTGKNVPLARLERLGWLLREAHDVTHSYDSFVAYVTTSRGEFGVCKSGYVRHNTGWFSDRSAVYLATGRPVVLQETGFSSHLPCGVGLFAVSDAEEAAEALDRVESEYQRHARAARRIAEEYLDTRVVLTRFLEQLGIA